MDELLALNARLHELHAELGIKVARIDVELKNIQGRVQTIAAESPWTRRIFLILLVSLGLHVGTMIWLAAVTTQATAFRDEMTKNNATSISAIFAASERFGRMEAEMRAVKEAMQQKK